MRRFGRLIGVVAAIAVGIPACRETPLPDKVAPPVTPPVVSVATPPPPVAPSYDNICIQAQADRVPVIMYHDVIAKRGKGAVWFDCTKAEFEEQMNWLAQQGAHVVSLDDLYKHLTSGDALPENAVVLTFDDNYQGFYDNAYPILKKRNYPSAMFVHTNYVGDKKSDHPKMDWDTLKQLDAEKLVTIGSHTQSHPDDMRKLPPAEQEKELSGAKTILETHLGHPIPYLAYPNGRQDNVTKELARKCGYTMAFTIDNGPAEASPDILLVNRTIQTRLEKVWKECHDAKLYAPAAVVQFDLNPTPVKLEIGEFAGVKLGIVRGGAPTTHHSPVRQCVGQFIADVPGGVAGINGTFFADARINGADTTLIGPSQNPADVTLVPDLAEDRLPRLINRPIVLWGPKKIAIVPFQPATMNVADPFKAYMPDYTELFLAGRVDRPWWHTAHDRRDAALFGRRFQRSAPPRLFWYFGKRRDHSGRISRCGRYGEAGDRCRRRRRERGGSARLGLLNVALLQRQSRGLRAHVVRTRLPRGAPCDRSHRNPESSDRPGSSRCLQPGGRYDHSAWGARLRDRTCDRQIDAPS